MKSYKIITLLLLLIISTNKLNAENSLHLGISAGLAIPNEKVSQFFDEAKQYIQKDSINAWGNYLFNKASNVGYNIKLQGRIELSDYFTFVPSVGISRFNDGVYDLVVPFGNGDTAHAKTQSTTNVVPISIGINAYLFKSFISPYVSADLVYNYIAYSYDFIWDEKFAAPIATSTTMHRIGYSVGAGIDIDLALISLNLEAKFDAINIIKYNGHEPSKNYYTFSVGIIF
jgi:hypothetical protein